MKKHLKVMSVLLSAMFLLSVSVSAHSGRTDSSGGHRDNQNKSGLGSYHYHCGGYPAHLHPDGICPYNSAVKQTSITTQKQENTSTQPDYFVLSKMRTFINNEEIPKFSHSKIGGACVIAEDLKDYGFDTEWNQLTKTLSITKNANKTMAPLPMSYYNSFGAGYKFFKVNDSNPVTILLKNTATDIGYSPSSYSCGGYMAISIDELKAFTDDWNWSTEDLTMKFNIQ